MQIGSAVDKQHKGILKEDCTKCTVQFLLANGSIKYDIELDNLQY